MRQPLVITVAAVLSWSLVIVVTRVLLVRYGFDPWTFTFIQLCAGGVALIVAGGRGGFSMTSFRRPSTWVLGVLRVVSAALFTATLASVSAMEAGILGSVMVPMVAVAVWSVFGRRPARFEWIGHGVILAAVAALIGVLEDGLAHPAVLLMLGNEVCLVAATLIAERHPDNASNAPGARLRFTGAVLVVTSGLFLMLRLLQDGGTAGIVWDGTLVAAGAAVGILLRAPSMVLSFWSTRLVGSQNYLAAASTLPVIGMVLEAAAFRLGAIDVSRFQTGTALLAGGVVMGTLLVVAIRIRAVRSAR